MISTDDYVALRPFRDATPLYPMPCPDDVAPDVIYRLRHLGLIRSVLASIGLNKGIDKYVITPLGNSELVEYERIEDQRKQAAKDKAEQEAEAKEHKAIEDARYKADSRRSWLQLIVGGLIGLVTGMLIEHYLDLINLFSASKP